MPCSTRARCRCRCCSAASTTGSPPRPDSLGATHTPIVQFGTSRFLLAHVALFVSQALERGAIIDAWCTGHAVHEALQAERDWPRLQHKVAHDAAVIVSNTADRGYQLDDADDAALLAPVAAVPRSFPAKLLVLLHRRWQLNRDAPLSIFPCELIERNGEVLRDLLVGLAHEWSADGDFVDWLHAHCVWANSLVDRIVSAPLQPVGAVAEPYALWAVEAQSRLQLPCRHESIVLTDDLARHARLKLFLLNGGHSFLAERWLRAEIAQNHAQKKQRRFAPLLALAGQLGLRVAQARLRAAMSRAD